MLKKIKAAAKAAGLECHEVELSRHTGIIVGVTRSTIGRHSEVPDGTARVFWKQFENELGEGWRR